MVEPEYESLVAAVTAKFKTQREFARVFGISPAHANNLIHGRFRPGPKLALKLSRRLSVSLHSLLER